MRFRKTKVKEYKNAHGTITSAHERNVPISDQELKQTEKLSHGAQLGLSRITSKNPNAGLPEPTSPNYEAVLAPLKAEVIEGGPLKAAQKISEKLENLSGNETEAINMARECGALCAYVLKELGEQRSAYNKGRTIEDVLQQKNAFHHMFYNMVEQKLTAEQDAAFIQGIMHSDAPNTSSIVRQLSRNRIMNFVRRDPEMMESVEDVSRRYWKESFGSIKGFGNAKRFDDLNDLQKDAVIGYHMNVAAASIVNGQLDNYKDATNSSIGKKLRMAQLRRHKKKIKNLYSESKKERRLGDISSAKDRTYRDEMNTSNYFKEIGADYFASTMRRFSHDSRSERTRAQKEGNRIAAERRRQRNETEGKLSRMKGVPWWLKQRSDSGGDSVGVTPDQSAYRAVVAFTASKENA